MSNKIEVLIKNFDIKNKCYLFGKQEIIHLEINELKQLLNEIPSIISNNENFPIEIITKDLIIIRINEDDYSYRSNRVLLHKNLLNSKKTFKLDEFTKIFNKEKEFYWKKYVNLIIYLSLLFIIWTYFLSINIASISLFFRQNYEKITINLFLIWLLIFLIMGYIHFFIIDVMKPFIKPYLKPLEYSSPSKGIAKHNDLNNLLFFSGQLICFFILYYLYYLHLPSLNIYIIRRNFILFLIFFTLGIFVSVNYVINFIYRLNFNVKIKEEALNYLYSMIQEIPFSKEVNSIYIKMINDLENIKIIKLGITTKLIGILTLIFALIPNIIINI